MLRGPPWPGRMPRLPILGLVVLSTLVLACDDGTTEPAGGRVVEGVDLDLLFAQPSMDEIDAVRAEWSSRAPAAEDVSTEADTVVTIGEAEVRVRVVGHDTGGSRHYGAILSPTQAAASGPVLIYAHGGDSGVDVEEVLALLPFAGELGSGTVWVIPSFRSESLRFGDASWVSGGPPSPWDRDVDDALALLEVTLATEPAADEERIGVLGLSRGAGVAMLMAIRDERIDRVVEFFGPTDFFGPYVQELVEEALRGAPRDLPGLRYLDETLIQPLRLGELTIAQVRPALIRRSTVLHAELLGTLQLHHGTADAVVDVSQAEALISAMEMLGRDEPTFQGFLYPGGTHNPFTLPGSIDRALAFLGALSGSAAESESPPS